MVWRVTYPIFVQSVKVWRRFARAADKAIARVDPHDSSAHVRKALGRFSGTEAQEKQLLAIASRPAEESLFDSMQLFYLDRALLALVGLVGAWWAIGAAQGFIAKTAAAVAVAIVYALFAGVGVVLARRRAACGCFGEDQTPVSLGHALVSLVLGAVAAAAAFASPRGLAWLASQPAWNGVGLAVGIGGAAYAVVLVYTAVPRAWAAWSGE
jgi:multidrug transporter EmrE-like cation transporter